MERIKFLKQIKCLTDNGFDCCEHCGHVPHWEDYEHYVGDTAHIYGVDLSNCVQGVDYEFTD